LVVFLSDTWPTRVSPRKKNLLRWRTPTLNPLVGFDGLGDGPSLDWRGLQSSLTEIAQRAGLVIGSLYQYFSDKSAIHRAILLQHQTEVRQMLHDYGSRVRTMDQFVEVMKEAFERYFALHQQDPVFNALWGIVQTDAELQRIDMEDTLQNGRYLQSICSSFLPKANPDRLVASCALVTHLALATARFARNIPPNLAQYTRPLFRTLIRDAYAELAADACPANRKK
jgi:AcrR family transcriptional regulator